MVLAHKSRALLAVCLMAAASSVLIASKPVFWQTATETEFLRGEVENLSIDGHGRLVLGPATELFAETTAPFLWSMAARSEERRVGKAGRTRRTQDRST